MQLNNFITRKGKFDAGHRVMHERFKCANIHGHEFRYEMTFACPSFEEIGYGIDFKELKRIGCEWIDEHFDHVFIANPHDKIMLETCRVLNSKLYVMSLIDEEGFCNPTAENVAKELFFSLSVLLNDPLEKSEAQKLFLTQIRLFETTDSYVDCHGLTETEWEILHNSPLYFELLRYRHDKKRIEYDGRKIVIPAEVSIV